MRRKGGRLMGGVGELARPVKGVLGLYENVMGECDSSPTLQLLTGPPPGMLMAGMHSRHF